MMENHLRNRMAFFRKYIKTAKHDLFMIGVLCVAAWKLTCGLEYFMDIKLSDESLYLYSGIQISDYGIPKFAEYSPLYAFWYYLLSLFQPDKIQLYYLNYKVLAGLLPILMYLLFRRYRVSVAESGCLAGFVLLAHANLPVWPKVGHLAVLLSLLFFLIATCTNSFDRATLILSIGALLSSYVRPEFFMTYVLLIGLSLIIAVIKKHFTGKDMYLFVMVILLSIVCIILLGVPAFSRNGERSFFAFSQHFAVNWVTWTRSDINPWTNCEEIVTDNFGLVRSIPEAYENNPSVFLKHVVSNLKNTGKTLTKLLTPKYNKIFLPNNKLFHLIEITFLFGMIGLYLHSIKKRWLGKLSSKFQQHKNLFVHFGLYSIPGFIAAIIIFPRDHYLLLQSIFFLIVIACILIKNPCENHIIIDRQHVYILGFLIIAFTPTPENTHPYQLPGQYQYNLKTIHFLNSLKIKEQVNLLETEGGGYSIYVGENYNTILEVEKNTSYEMFMQEKNLNMIILNDTLKEDTRFKDDKEWQLFLTKYESFGFIKIAIDGTPFKLLVKKDLLYSSENT
ncbi:hypothetical protein U27_02132 [Candidatus Vecturithrix granuli]|uniref:Glycosyltransferase RgtA/B/C/D-like domain-containing protein n=1 Tax=Vecturithrix granuli TaxID=1499967 RepID=A0A0S6WAA1_VECG1|nr:hypothetical protein U27_02132 [Candidatus Vecturithrix granuli]